FGRLTADQGATRLMASVSNSGQKSFRSDKIQLSGRVIIEEKERLSSATDKIVHAHRDQILSNRFVQIEMSREFDLRADSVGARNQARFLHFGVNEAEDRRKPADSRNE